MGNKQDLKTEIGDDDLGLVVRRKWYKTVYCKFVAAGNAKDIVAIIRDPDINFPSKQFLDGKGQKDGRINKHLHEQKILDELEGTIEKWPLDEWKKSAAAALSGCRPDYGNEELFDSTVKASLTPVREVSRNLLAEDTPSCP